jgi:hypothetical protein
VVGIKDLKVVTAFRSLSDTAVVLPRALDCRFPGKDTLLSKFTLQMKREVTEKGIREARVYKVFAGA